MSSTKKTLGILGGMGPYASLDFARRIVGKTPAAKDWDHIRTIHDSAIHIPSRTRAILYGETSPVDGMVEAIGALARYGAEVVVVPCNSAHFFFPEVAPRIAIPWLNMLELVAAEVKQAHKNRPLVLGGYVTVTRKTYSSHMDCVYLNDDENAAVCSLIEAVKINDKPLYEQLAANVISLINVQKREQGIDAVVLGCTELSTPEAFSQMTDIAVFDTTDIYAEKTVEYCIGRAKSVIAHAKE